MDRQVGIALDRKPVGDLAAADIARAVTTGFEGYFVPVALEAAGYDARFRAEDVDPFTSHVYTSGGAFVGIVLIARRGWTSRIAAMGIAKAMRGRGFGAQLVSAAIRDARERGDRRMLLEVIATNTRAIRLYERHGFRPMRDLVGFTGRSAPGIDALREIDPVAVARRMLRDGETDLPWQLAPETLLKAVAPAVGLALDDRGVALVAPAGEDKLLLRTLYVPPEHRQRGTSRQLLAAIAARFPDRTISTPVAVQSVLSGVFAAPGFTRIAISQHEMALDLL